MRDLRSWAGPTALGVAVAAAGGGAVLLIRSSGSDGVHPGSNGNPPKLHLASYADHKAMGAPASYGGQWQLEGTLPTETPADGRVRRPSGGSSSAAGDLAKALGLSGTPTEVKGGWALRGDNSTIVILRKDGSWSWGMDCNANGPIEDENLDVGCASAIGYAPPGPPPGPSAADTEKAATPVFRALGLDGTVNATAGSELKSYATVSPASGWSTTLEVSRSLDVVGGNGWLPGSTEGDAYPLISASAAWEALKASPRVIDDMCRVRDDGKPGCADPEPTVITGASLGLMLDRDASGALLVPAWLFAVKDSTETIPWIAVDPAYLESYSPPDGGDPGTSGSGSGSSDGSTGSGGAPTQVDPAPPDASPGSEPNSGSGSSGSAPSSRSTNLGSYSLDGDSTIVGYVELTNCESATLLAKEAPDVVYLAVEITVPGGKVLCSSATRQEQPRVTLDAPLGTRAVRNSDGSEIPRRK